MEHAKSFKACSLRQKTLGQALFELKAPLTYKARKILQSEPWTSWGQENCLSTPKGCTGATTSVGSSR